MLVRPRLMKAASLTAFLAVVMALLGGATPTAASAMSEPPALAWRVDQLADPSARAPRSGTPALSESVPDDAMFLVSKRYGRGDSQRLHFRVERNRLFTVAFTCEAPRSTKVEIAVTGLTRKQPCRVPSSSTIRDDRVRQWVMVDAPRSVRWVVAVYEGTPDGITID